MGHRESGSEARLGPGTEERVRLGEGWDVDVRRGGDGAKGHVRTSALGTVLCWRAGRRGWELEG